MADAAGLHDPIRSADVWGGYLRSPHSSGGGWPLSYWDRIRAVADELLPIYVIGPPYNADAIVASIRQQMIGLGAPTGVAVAIDVEHYDAASAHAAGVWPQLQARMPGAGYDPVVYCSLTDAHLFPGKQYLAHWTNKPVRELGAAIMQFASPISMPSLKVDLDMVFDDSLRLWPVRTVPTPGGKMDWLPPVPAQSGVGYYAVDQKGEVYAFGAAKYHGGVPTLPHGTVVSLPIAGLAPTPDDGGYWLIDATGHAFTFGNAPYLGSPADPPKP